MKDHDSRAFGDKEPFDFCLSAFLSAARSVDWRLRHEHKAAYEPWRKEWDATLTAQEDRLIKFMVDDRNLEVHESGSTRGVKDERTNIQGTYSDKSGTITVSGPPLTLGGPLENPTAAFIIKPAYFFIIDGAERKATYVFGEYLTLLEQMVAKFKADHP